MKIKLLLVDDEAIIRQGIEKMINWEGLGITLTGSCPNALSALESMTDDMPDILMTDIKMPGMDGLELIERALALHSTLKCIILSGYDEFSFAKKAIQMGVNDYLLKPCSQSEMEEALARVCRDVEAENQKVRYLYDVRQERVHILADQLLQLRPEPEGASDILPAQVRHVAKAAGDPGLLREAFMHIVTHHLHDQGRKQWGFDVVQDVYADVNSLENHIAAGLTALAPYRHKRRSFVSSMLTYIHEHYSDPQLSLQYLADHVAHMNADYVGKEFTRDVGMKLSAYLLQVRMEHAKMLLALPQDMRMYEIAEQVGFGHNPNYFSRVFYKYTGMTPKEFRNTSIND